MYKKISYENNFLSKNNNSIPESSILKGINKFIEINKNDIDNIDIYTNKYKPILYHTPYNRKNYFCHQISDLSPFSIYIPNSLNNNICNKIIETFDKNTANQYQGVCCGGGIHLETKVTMDLKVSNIHPKDLSLEIDNILSQNLTEGIRKYAEYLESITYENNIDVSMAINCNNLFHNSEFKDTGYQIQRYVKNIGFFKWHHDCSFEMIDNKVFYRALTFIWYLNDVEEGGETEFLFGKLKPKAGTLLLFPSNTLALHKGHTPISNDKYIITGWLYSYCNTK